MRIKIGRAKVKVKIGNLRKIMVAGGRNVRDCVQPYP
jgi:hypothetical protein